MMEVVGITEDKLNEVLFVHFNDETLEESRERLEMMIVEAVDADGLEHMDDEYIISPITIRLAMSHANMKWFNGLPLKKRAMILDGKRREWLESRRIGKKAADKSESAAKSEGGNAGILPGYDPSRPYDF